MARGRVRLAEEVGRREQPGDVEPLAQEPDPGGDPGRLGLCLELSQVHTVPLRPLSASAIQATHSVFTRRRANAASKSVCPFFHRSRRLTCRMTAASALVANWPRSSSRIVDLPQTGGLTGE